MSLACSTVRYSFRTSERTRPGSLSSGGPHPPPPPLRRLTFSPRTSLSPPTLRATIGSRPCLKTMQVFGVPAVPPSTPQGGYLARPTDTVKEASGQRTTYYLMTPKPPRNRPCPVPAS